MSELEPLPSDLRALIADEREAYPDDDVARARVMRRVEAAIAFAAVGAAGGAAAAAAAAKTGLLARLGLHAAKHAKLWIALSFVGGVVLGETHARLSPSEPSPSTRPATTVTTTSPATTPASATTPAPATSADEPAPISVSALPPSRTAAPSAAPPASTPAPPAGSSTLAAEQALIDTARSALSRGRASDALRAADDHAQQFPRGRLAEEREMLAIQALLLAGRRGDAEARGKRFHARYPQSLYASAVDALLGTDGGR